MLSSQSSGQRASMASLPKELLKSSPFFFSDKGLAQDILEVTNAEPDIPLETFYSLYETFWPQIKQSGDLSFINAWNYFLGGPLTKGILSPPELLVPYKKIKTIQEILLKPKGESEIFRDFDAVIRSIKMLKHRLEMYSSQEISQREEILVQLDNVMEFYQRYKDKTKQLLDSILRNSENGKISVDEYGEWENLVEPKAIMMGDIFSEHWAYRIPREKAQTIRPRDTNKSQLDRSTILDANHYVCALPKQFPKVYFKANGHPLIKPEKEFMVYSLYKQLQIPVPQTAVLIFSSIFDNSHEFFAVQASEAVPGDSVLKALEDPVNYPVLSEPYIQQIIGAILTNPYDGSFKNFKYSPKYQTFVSIDNDLVFKKEIKGNSPDKLYMNVKTFLYTLPKIAEIVIPNSIKTMYKTLDPDLTIALWMQELGKKNQEYDLLFNSKLAFQNVRFLFEKASPQDSAPNVENCLKEIIKVDKDLPFEKRFFPQIKISNKLIQTLDYKLKKLHEILSKSQPLNPQDLLNCASEIVGKYYQALRSRFPNPEEALYALWQKEDDTDYTLLSSLLDKSIVLNQQQVNNEQKNQLPEDSTSLLKTYKMKLSVKTMSPLYSLVVRHGERLFQGVLNSTDLISELRFIIQENLTGRYSPSNLINFWFKTKAIFQDDPILLNEYSSLILSIPDEELRWLFKLEQYFLRINDKNKLDYPHYPLPIEGAFLKKRIFCLTQEQKSFLFDTQGLLKKYPLLPGRSKVSYYPPDDPEFYLKAFPEFPGYEYASTSFMRLLGISHLPYQDLLIVKNSEAAGYYPLLLSENVKGTTVLQAWDHDEAFHNLDPSHTFLLILSAMLLNPEDGKEDNFILSADQKYLIPIDNDHCFLPGTIQKQVKFWNIITPSTTLQIKTLLFCLDEMQKPIPASVKAHYLALNIDELMKTWMEKLVDIQERYESLVDPELLPKLFEQGTVLRIPFNKSFIENMYWKAHKIQEIFRIGTDLTPFDLLRALEPYVAKHYQDAFKKSNSLKERFKIATEDLYTKKMQNNDRMSILNTKAMIKIVNVPLEEISDESTILCKNGPVSTFEYIKELCANRKNNLIQNKYDILEISGQRGQHIWADLSNQIHKVEKLKQFFRQPKEGLILQDGDLLFNSNLQDYLKMASEQSAKIRFLTILNSTSLSQKEINLLIKGCPNLEYLNISKSSSLEQIIIKKGDWLSLTRLEARKCPKLQLISLNSPVQVLRVGSSVKLKIDLHQVDPDILEISLKPKTRIHFDKSEGFFLQKSASQKPCLVDALMNKTSFDEYSLQNLQLIIMNKTFFNFGSEFEPALWYNLSLKLLKQEELNLPEIFNTYYFQLPNFSKVNLSGVLFSPNTQDLLTHLDISHWRNLASLNLSNNNLSLEKLQGLFQCPWPNLEDLDISFHVLTKKDLFTLYLESDWPKLKAISLAGNLLDQSQIPDLTALFLNRLQVTSLDLENIDLGDLPIKGKTYTKLDWINIKTLNLANNNLSPKQLIEIPFQAWPNLQSLSLSQNKILDIGLDELCETTWNRLAHLDLSHNGLSYKAIKKLTAQKMPKLRHLDLSSNNISARDIPHIFDSSFPHLTEIVLESTLVTHKELIKLFSQRFYPTIAVSEIIKGGPGSPTLRSLDHTNKLLLVPEFGLEAEWENLEDSTQLMTLSLLEKSTGQSSSGSRKITEIQELSALMFEDTLSQEEMKTLKMLNMAGWFLMKTMTQGGEGMNKSQKGMEFRIEKSSAQKMPRFTLKKSSPEKNHQKVLDNIFILGKWAKLEKPLLRYEILTIDQSTYMFCHVVSHENSTTVSSGFSLSDSFSSSEVIKKKIAYDLGYDSLPWEMQGFRLENFSIMETKILSFFSQGHSLEDSLECLNLSNNIIGAEGVKILTCKCWPYLKRVYLRNISATEKELEKLVKRSNWPNLRYLDLSKNSVVKAEFGMLASGQWPSMESLIIDQFSVSGEVFGKFMKDGANWPNLREFSFNVYYPMPAPEDIHIIGEIIKKWPKIKKKNVQVVEQNEKNIVSVKFVYHHT